MRQILLTDYFCKGLRLDVLKAMLDKGADVHHPIKNANMSLLDFMKTYFSEEQSLKPIIALMKQYA